MILLLGKNELIEEYLNAQSIRKEDILYCPKITTHYSELYEYIDVIENQKPKVIITQRLDMIDMLLWSELNIENVITLEKHNKKVRKRELDKEEARELRRDYEAELRGC